MTPSSGIAPRAVPAMGGQGRAVDDAAAWITDQD